MDDSQNVVERAFGNALGGDDAFDFVFGLDRTDFGEHSADGAEFDAHAVEGFPESGESGAGHAAVFVAEVLHAAVADDFIEGGLAGEADFKTVGGVGARGFDVAEIGEDIRLFAGDDEVSVGIVEAGHIEVVFGGIDVDGIEAEPGHFLTQRGQTSGHCVHGNTSPLLYKEQRVNSYSPFTPRSDMNGNIGARTQDLSDVNRTL